MEESTGQASANLICIDTTLPQMQQFQNLKNQFNMKLGQIKTVDPTALAEVTDAKLIVKSSQDGHFTPTIQRTTHSP